MSKEILKEIDIDIITHDLCNVSTLTPHTGSIFNLKLIYAESDCIKITIKKEMPEDSSI